MIPRNGGENSPRRVGAGAGRCAGLFPWGAANVFLVHHLTVVKIVGRGRTRRGLKLISKAE
jgi:hypothetical protein